MRRFSEPEPLEDDELDAFHALLHQRIIPLRPVSTAFIVVDMQKGFLDEGAPLEVPGGRALIPVINRVASACRELGIPVVFTQFVYDPQIPTLFGELHPEHKPAGVNQPTGLGYPSSCCLLGDESAALHPELERSDRDFVLAKTGYDAFHETPLDAYLRLRRIDTLLLAGVMTDVCVWHTVSGAVHRQYKVVVLRDAVATLSADVQRCTLSSIGWSVGRVLTSEQALAELKEAN